MTPRKASLRVAHQGSCPHANATTLASLKGCRCSPSFYTFHRGRDGKPVKGERVKDRKTAERSLNRLPKSRLTRTASGCDRRSG